MKRILTLVVMIAAIFATACSNYKYESVKGDPMGTRIYTLDNGLKVYMAVNDEMPSIQTYIAVRVGGKNDPAETTGLAHYFEHLMFKGTESFGTQNYAEEKPLLGDRVLCTNGRCVFEQVLCVKKDGTYKWDRCGLPAAMQDVTHWMPLPELPKEE